MPTLPEIIERLSFFATTPATVAVMFTAGAIVVIKDWRVSLLALVIQYIIVGLLLTGAIRVELAAIKTLVGAMLCLILYMTARHVDWGRPAPTPRSTLRQRPELAEGEAHERLPAEREGEPAEPTAHAPSASPALRARLRARLGSAEAADARGTLPTELPFRFLAALLVMVAAYNGALAYPLPDVSEAISLAVYTLVALGLLAMGLTDEPLKAGLGLLTFVSAFELFYTVLEPSLIVVGFLGLVNFLIALAVAYLTVARAASSFD
jgi:hypothetical protein